MLHHDNRGYEAAASEAARNGRVKLEETINAGIKNAEAVIERVTSRMIVDRVAKVAALKLQPAPKGQLILAAADQHLEIHPHAQRQIFADAGLPSKFADDLVHQANGTAWGAELIAHNVNTIFGHRPAQRNLLRAEGPRLMGFLSDKFRRLDSRPLLESFVGAAQKLGLVPIDGVASDTKVRVRALLPQVFEPVPNEVMAVGVEWGNSDYGDGGHVVSSFILRVWCTNLGIMTQYLKQIHLGKRLADNIEYSLQTYAADTKANALALADTVKAAIGPASVNQLMASIREVSADEVKGKDGIDKRLKSLSKSDQERVMEAFNGPDVQNLPPGQTTWRLSNAVSWIAQHKDNSPDKRLELQKLAGDLIPVRGEAAAVAV